MPNPPTSTIDQFYGMVRDRDGIEIAKQEFYTILNAYNNQLEGLIKRNGARKYASQTDSGGTKVNGLATFRNDSGTELYIKVSQNGNMYKNTGSGAWSQITASAPTFTNADTWFAQLSTLKTGASATATGTMEAADSTTITDNGGAFTINAFTGQILSVSNGEKKLIGANNATKIFCKERFDDVPSGTYNIYPRQAEFFMANGTDFYKCDGTTFTRLDNLPFSYAFVGICTHGQRLFGWKGTRLHYSDAGVGENFSRNSWQDFQSTIQCAQPLQKTLIIYEQKRVTSQTGDSPDNFTYTEILSDVGTCAPKSVATYQHMQFFLSNEYGVCVVSTEKLAAFGQKLEPLSVSKNYLNNEILAHTSGQLIAACATTWQGKYYLNIGTDVYVLHVLESMMAPRDSNQNIQWIWTKYSYPAAINPNVLGRFGTAIVSGSAASGQVYELEASGVNSDDGTAITRTIEKRDWAVTGGKDDKVFHSLKISSPLTSASVVENIYFDADGSTYGTADGTYDLNTEATFEHDIKIPSSLTDPKDRGKRVSFKLEEIGSNGPVSIEELVLLFNPDVLV